MAIENTQSMNKDKFWAMIDTARNKAGNWQDMIAPMQKSLEALSVQDIAKWQGIFVEYTHLASDDKVLGSAICIRNGISDDTFIDFRAWLIAQGKETYLTTLANPDSLAQNTAVQAFFKESIGEKYQPSDGFKNDPRFEDFGYLGMLTYEKMSGIDFKNDVAKLSPEIVKDIKSEIRVNDPNFNLRKALSKNRLTDLYPEISQIKQEIAFQKENSMDVLLIEPHKLPKEMVISKDQESLHKLLYGEVLKYAESTAHQCAILINPDQENLPYNRTLKDVDQETVLFSGNMVICGLDTDKQYCSLSKESKEFMKEQFKKVEHITIVDYEIQSVEIPPLRDKKDQSKEQQQKKNEPER